MAGDAGRGRGGPRVGGSRCRPPQRSPAHRPLPLQLRPLLRRPPTSADRRDQHQPTADQHQPTAETSISRPHRPASADRRDQHQPTADQHQPTAETSISRPQRPASADRRPASADRRDQHQPTADPAVITAGCRRKIAAIKITLKD